MGEHISSNIQVLHEEEEEALSLCDLPLDLHTNIIPRNDPIRSPNHVARTRISSPESVFEFFKFRNDDNGSDMRSAEDIISGGKLVPFGEKTSEKPHVLRKRSGSLSEFRSSSSAKSGDALLRISRSLDSQKQKLHRLDVKERVGSKKSFDQSEVSIKKNMVKPRWYVFVFGSVKFPPEMELKDIKSRQFRRNPSVLFPDDGKKAADTNRSSEKNKCSSWRLLKALSCRDYTSVAVTTSFYLPRA
ncbi:hypothetical protein V6N13_079022 [Hibiscus sabdariffa]|uniref:Uncharacterized protein n=1 Tax=Hibiscus sabdariffa TaxID=183260 RepID=A0ABR2RQ46_9ROSI